ncbi:putative transcriptional regulator with CopG/Arc/MetJ DNA-binding domain and metal-binding domain [Halovivax ruber XH-70]|uniref:Putative transcriptional regulator with CopG/Arc/MetJ DNA-binding domain and metal-binding domain n=1 Tax=Halovivax ruber (strain DSM 18193 / JCM 13892 / XH-70) TaxID=797302 RepID=L0I913_HALRX|nr:ribbon-helix-helix domain-containing protein [Halovivax ruber]AGB14731.1 putative transcriptional regulator with CopG/Arc/MetJ DNA-binding domain and metal-binding domain [Halovivax ruber XH-70]
MSTDTNAGDGRMEKINVRVPESLSARIDEEWERRGYTSKSEAIRDALRDWVTPPQELSDETLDALSDSRREDRQGETVSVDEARERLGLDD